MRRFLYIFFVYLPLALAALGVLFVPPLWPLLMFLVPCFCILNLLVLRRQKMVLQLLQTALETQTPLDEVFDAYAETCGGLWAHKIHRFAARFRDGFSFIAAARSVKGVLRYDAAAILHLGGDTDTLNRFLNRTANESLSEQPSMQSLFRLYWFSCYAPCLLLIPVFFMIAIVPKMEAIYSDFEMELPAITATVFAVNHWIEQNPHLIFPYLLAICATIFLYFVAQSDMIRRRPLGIRMLMRQKDAAGFLRIFAAGFEQNKTIHEIAGVYKQAVPSLYLKWQTDKFIRSIERGKNWIEALRSIRYLTHSEMALLQSAVQVKNVPLILNEIAVNKEQRQTAANRVHGEITYLCILLLVGAFVCVQAVAFFIPLVKLITVLAN